MDEMTVAISDLMAGLVRKGKQIVAVGIILAVILGGMKGFKLWKNATNEDYLDSELVLYEQEKQRLEKLIEKTNRSIEEQEEYLANSLWMQINPREKYVAEVYLAVSEMDEADAGITFGDNTTPIEYLTKRIVSQYRLLWTAMDLPSTLQISQFQNIADKYVRELVDVNFSDTGIISIHAIGNSKEEAMELAESVYRAFQSKHSTVVSNSFKHSLESFDSVQQTLVDLSMAEMQIVQRDLLDEYDATIVKASVSLKELIKPDSVPVAVVKMVILGGIAGVLVACAFYCSQFLLTGRLQSVAHGERTLKTLFIGSAVAEKRMLWKAADQLTGDCIWESEEQALSYIAEIVKNRVTPGQLLLVSSLDLKSRGGIMKKLQKTLSGKDSTVARAEDFSHNAEALALLKACDAVILVESVDKTRLDKAAEILRFAEEYDKPVAGFVLV